MSRQQFNSGAPWESIVGYSRAIRVDRHIEVSGTCAVDDEGKPFAIGDPYQQTVRILAIIRNAIENLGGKIENVTRTRIFVTNMKDWEEVGKAHGEIFNGINPVTTMVEVSKLISTDYVVEIEATAYLDQE